MATKIEELEQRVKVIEEYMCASKAKWELFSIITRFIGPVLLLVGIIEFVAQHGIVK